MGLKVMLCGMGGYGENYVKEYLTRDVLGSSLVAVCDPYAEKSPLYEEVKEKGIAVYSSPEEFYRSDRADLCIISSPIHTHYPYIMTALENGSNVLTEKPVCFRPDEIETMEKKSASSSLFVAVGYQLCFSHDVLALKRDILSGLYGMPLRMRTIRLMRRNDIYYSRSAWAGAEMCHNEPVYDSPFTNACAHQYQNMVFLLGKKMDESGKSTSVRGSLIRVRPTITNCDTAVLSFSTESGVELYYYASHAVDEVKLGPLSTYEFEKGTVEETEKGFVGYLKDGRMMDYTLIDRGERMEKLWESLRCIEEKREPVCTLKTSSEHTHAVLEAQRMGVVDLTQKAFAKKDDKGSTYYTIPGLGEALKSAYDNWSIDLDINK